MKYDSGTYEANMDLAMRIADVDGFKQRKREAKKRGKLLGLGITNYVESSIGAPKERAEITVKPQGRVGVVIGTQPSGQGHETSFAQVTADLLHLPVETVDIIVGDTDIVSVGGGSHSGRSMRHAGTVIAKTANDLIAKSKKIAATILDAPEDSVQFDDGRFSSPEQQPHVRFLRAGERSGAASAAGAQGRARRGSRQRDARSGVSEWLRDLRGRGRSRNRACRNRPLRRGGRRRPLHQPADRPWPDPRRHRAGRRPGDVGAMRDRRRRPASRCAGSFMDYGMPRSNTLPSFKAEIVEVLSPTNPLGIKAGGEGGTTPALAVMVSAIVDALREFGVRNIVMPATPFTVWQAIQDAKAAAARRTA